MVDLAVNIWADCPQTSLPVFMFRFAGQVAEGTRHNQSPLVPPKPSQRFSARFVSYLLIGSSRAGMVVETKRMARGLRDRCMKIFKFLESCAMLYMLHACSFFFHFFRCCCGSSFVSLSYWYLAGVRPEAKDDDGSCRRHSTKLS